MLAFDTLQYSKNLAAGGFTTEQAETLAREQTALLEDQLATKADIRDVRGEIAAVRSELKAEMAAVRRDLEGTEERLKAEFKAEIADVRHELKADIADVRGDIKAMEAKIMKWTIGLFLGLAAVMTALTKFF